MKKTMSIIIVVLGFVMFHTNPNQTDYSRWVGEQLKKDQNALMEIGVDLAVIPYVEANTTRTNRYLFSVYRTKLWNDKDIVAYGLFNHFYINKEKLEIIIDES